VGEEEQQYEGRGKQMKMVKIIGREQRHEKTGFFFSALFFGLNFFIWHFVS